MRTMFSAAVAIATIAVAGAQAEATVLTYTITGTGSGSLAGTAFDNAAFTFTLVGDTANLVGNGYQAIDPLDSASFTITGSGSGIFALPTRLGIYHSAAFFSRGGDNGADLFDFQLSHPQDLTQAFSLVGTDVFALEQFQNVVTTSGLLSFDSSGDVVFANDGATVPEPAAWTLMIAGFGLVGTALRRRATAPA